MPILVMMTPARRCALGLLAVLPVAALALTGCEDELAGEVGPLGGGSLDQSVSDTQAQAPEPSGDQFSHEQMREALQEHAGGTVTDTDDWWPHLRDLNRELQKLQVQPTDCKPYVTASALPVPTGALGALAEAEDSQAVIYTFEDPTSAQDHLQTERTGMESCAEHTVVRDLGELQAEAVTELDELNVSTGAEEAVAVRRMMSDDDGTQRHLTLMLRHGAQLVLIDQPEDEDSDQDEAVVELEAAAALILSDLVGEEILAPQPQPEDDEEEDNDDAADTSDEDTEGADED